MLLVTENPPPADHQHQEPSPPPHAEVEIEATSLQYRVNPTSHTQDGPVTLSPPSIEFSDSAMEDLTTDQLESLESLVRVSNPRLHRLTHEAQAARARVAYLDRLPDPTLAANGMPSPIETAAGSQRANLSLSQMLPWLPRLDAQAQQACFEAVAVEQRRAAEELRVIADLRVAWYRLYVINKQIEANQANQVLVQRLINIATSRIGVDQASQNDVLDGSMELGRLEESMLVLQQRRASTQAELSRLVGQSIAPATGPMTLDVTLPDSTPDELTQLAYRFQPDIAAAETEVEASRWSVEVARLRRRPEITLNASWFAIDDNRPPVSFVDVGQDAWSLGAMISLPIDRCKYDAIAEEARWRHSASHASVDEVRQQYDYLIRDLWEQASAAASTARLYRETILPQANQVLETNLLSYSNGEVEFDRVLEDVRRYLNLELNHHQAIGRLASTLARLEQATGFPLDSLVE